ncbi:MAG: hypothetical protein KGH60_04835 [Candidatus Micrarchaeota archaeon]|nr:hypothetical protein [Candidatus Micrarchaeota archaeon]
MAKDALHYALLGLLVIVLIVSVLAYTKPVSVQQAPTSSSNVTNSFTAFSLMLAGQTIPAGGYLHVLDISPDQIYSGHVALHMPCSSNGTSQIVLLLGSAPSFQPIYLNNTEILGAISSPGGMCIYHFYIGAVYNNIKYPITDIAILNPTNQSITLPATSGATLTVIQTTPAGGT